MKNIHLITLCAATFLCFTSRADFLPQDEPWMGEEKIEETAEADSKRQTHFEFISQSFQNLFSSRVKKLLQKELIIRLEWKDTGVNAHATRDMQDNAIIVIKGGFLRHPHMNSNVLILLLCHELGHHLGGAPKKLRGRSTKKSWSSAEGQADYFATSKCLPSYYSKHPELMVMQPFNQNKDFNPRYRETIAQLCKNDKSCSSQIHTAYQLATMFSQIRRFSSDKLSLTQRERVEVSQTIGEHSSAQCRLDTLVSGLFCRHKKDQDFSDQNTIDGACIRKAYEEENLAARPYCWFFPNHLFEL